MQNFIDFVKKLLSSHPELNNNQIISIIKLVCQYGQPFLDTVCPLVNSGAVGHFPEGVNEAHELAVAAQENSLHEAIDGVREELA